MARSNSSKQDERAGHGSAIRVCFLAGLICLASLVSAPARLVQVTILHTTDLHGHLLPTTDYDGNTGVGGFLQCAGRIAAWKAKRPHALLIDCGDLFQGSPESFRARGRVMMEALSHFSYDAWVLGNHDFDWGLDLLADLVRTVPTPVLAANMYTLPGHPNPLASVKPYVMLSVEGVNVAVIGLITPGIPRWSRPELIQSMLFKPSVEAMREILPRVRAEGADIVIVAAHQGYREFGDDHANELNAVARAFPEIDAIIGGHTHRPIEQASINGVLYTQAGYHGIWLGILELTFDTVSRKVVHRSAKLERVGPGDPWHPPLAEAWEGLITSTQAELDRPLTRSSDVFTPHPSRIGISPVQRLISRAIADASKADFVLHGALSSAILPEGPIAVRHVWDIVPYENTIGIAHLNVSEIKEILEESLALRATPFMLGPLGFHYRIETHDGVRRAVELRDEKGRPLHSRRRYKVAFNSYTLASGGNRFPRLREIVDQPSSRLTMLEIDTRTAVQRYLRSKRVLSLEKIMEGAP
ncbi:MAG TPA: bifunctional UDP-sugar hydrolase/5'-nucleotidase [Kiritimatiellia bacterium]|nr:bifunctional UDP-sugar hydrolase/5'-nucleotidase [Kiritimatiellia bacterium]